MKMFKKFEPMVFFFERPRARLFFLSFFGFSRSLAHSLTLLLSIFLSFFLNPTGRHSAVECVHCFFSGKIG